MADQRGEGGEPKGRNWGAIGAIGGLLSGVAAVIGVVLVVLNLDGGDQGYGPSPTTSLGSPSTAASTAGVRSSLEALGLQHDEAKRLLEDDGWNVELEPALVRDRPHNTVVGVRAAGLDVRLLVADVPFCEAKGDGYPHCDGRPVAQYEASKGSPVQVGQVLEMTDQSAGVVTARRWRWQQGGATGYFTSEEATMSFAVGGSPDSRLEVTLEVSNAEGSDEVAFGWDIVA